MKISHHLLNIIHKKIEKVLILLNICIVYIASRHRMYRERQTERERESCTAASSWEAQVEGAHYVNNIEKGVNHLLKLKLVYVECIWPT